MAYLQDQVAGIQRRRVGDSIVTALSDGFVVIPSEALQGLGVTERDAIYHGAGRRPPFASSINAYLLQWPSRTILIDAGSGLMMGPDAGRLGRSLESAGVAHADVDIVLLTHLHPDHAGGLLTEEGGPAFPRCNLMIAEAEFSFWTNKSNWNAAPESTRDTFDLANRVAQAYEGRLSSFTTGDSIPDMEFVPLPGHTPGHTGYAVRGSGETFVIWGDICHAPEIQFARPDVTTIFDNDPVQAIKSRRLMFERAVKEDLLIAGMHMSFPGFTRVARAGDGYVLQPQTWQYVLATDQNAT